MQPTAEVAIVQLLLYVNKIVKILHISEHYPPLTLIFILMEKFSCCTLIKVSLLFSCCDEIHSSLSFNLFSDHLTVRVTLTGDLYSHLIISLLNKQWSSRKR